MNWSDLIFIIILLTTISIGFLSIAFALKKLGSINKNAYSKLFKFSLFYVSILISLNALSYGGYQIFGFGGQKISNIIGFPLQMTVEISVIIFSIWLAGILGIFQFNGQHKTVDIKQQVDNLWESKEFLTSLRDVLPKGEGDKKYGLDYIPYMLQNVDQRRQRYSKTSTIFLYSTIILGIIFSLIIMFFSNILINEESAGVPRLLKELQSDVAEVKKNTKLLLPEYIENEGYNKHVKSAIETLESYKPIDKEEKKLIKSINQKTYNIKNFNDLSSLVSSLYATRKSLIDLDSENDYLLRIIDNAIDHTEKIINKKESALPKISNLIPEIENKINLISSKEKEPDSRQVELLKRLALGIIVSSFFLAILRYVAGLYRENHRQMLKAENDDLRIRQFYVAIKGSGDDNENKIDIMKKFLDINNDSTESNQDSYKLSKEETGILKDVISIISKKV